MDSLAFPHSASIRMIRGPLFNVPSDTAETYRSFPQRFGDVGAISTQTGQQTRDQGEHDQRRDQPEFLRVERERIDQ